MSSPRMEVQPASYYRDTSQQFIFVLIILIFVLLFMGALVLAQVVHRPLPEFTARRTDGRVMALTTYREPNLTAKTILTWASQAAVAAYTFNFASYATTIPLARPYFTPGGWQAYQSAINPVLQTITKAQLIVQSVVAGAPVIANQGPLPGHGYTWRVQIPFLVTYLSAGESKSRHYYVVMMLVRVPTNINPQGIGIDTFEMK